MRETTKRYYGPIFSLFEGVTTLTCPECPDCGNGLVGVALLECPWCKLGYHYLVERQSDADPFLLCADCVSAGD